VRFNFFWVCFFFFDEGPTQTDATVAVVSTADAVPDGLGGLAVTGARYSGAVEAGASVREVSTSPK